MIPIEEFWGSNYYKHPALTDEMILIAESRLQVSLPKAYIKLLRVQNGGYTKGFGYPVLESTSWSDNHIPLNQLAGIVTDPDHRTAQNILDTAYMTNEWGLPPRQALLSGDGHWWVSLDYRNNDNPSVVWLDTDDETQTCIAENFDMFLSGLAPESSFDAD